MAPLPPARCTVDAVQAGSPPSPAQGTPPTHPPTQQGQDLQRSGARVLICADAQPHARRGQAIRSGPWTRPLAGWHQSRGALPSVSLTVNAGSQPCPQVMHLPNEPSGVTAQSGIWEPCPQAPGRWASSGFLSSVCTKSSACLAQPWGPKQLPQTGRSSGGHPLHHLQPSEGGQWGRGPAPHSTLLCPALLGGAPPHRTAGKGQPGSPSRTSSGFRRFS